MKILMRLILLVGLQISALALALAAPEKETSITPQSTLPATAKPTKKADASATAHNFEDLLVQGKYHFSEEAVSTVEDDKVLDSLIGVRSDFKDRLKSSTGSY